MQLFNSKGYIPTSVFSLLETKLSDPKNANSSIDVIADLIRFNTLLSVARAGTGHLGASLSMIELLAEIYFRSFYFDQKKKADKNRDIFILSKGHGAPSLYATLAAKGYFPTRDLDRLRRLKGLQGHCDIVTSGIEANTGSLAMGLSKAVGYAIVKKRFGLNGSVIVIVGDAELQEGQCWESFLSAASYLLNNLFVIVDDNKVQTDQYSKNIVQYGNLQKALELIGFEVLEIDGRSCKDIHKAFSILKNIPSKPKLIWANTRKGQGISYMEHPNVLKNEKDRYVWHNKAPNVEQLRKALNEILDRLKEFKGINGDLKELFRNRLQTGSGTALQNIPKEPMTVGIEGKSLISGFAKGLVEIGKRDKRIVVIDGDLEEDCGFIPFHKAFPERFFEMGIMEQHIVSTAAALSRLGFLPVISTYAAFLTSRANEQLYNLASEDARAIIVGNMSGVIPATPGKSHQAFRDIACMKNTPGFTMYQPISADDAKNALERYVNGDFGKLLYLRLSMAPSAVELNTPPSDLPIGSPHVLKRGKDVLIIGIGPVVLGECLKAAEDLEKKGKSVEVWNHPWLVDFDINCFSKVGNRNIPLVIVEDHFHKGGMGESLLAFFSKRDMRLKDISHIALRNFPETGFRDEALHHFRLDRQTIISEVMEILMK